MKMKLAFGLMLCLGVLFQSNAQFTQTCTLTFDQGYQVGWDLGVRETYYGQYYNAFQNTRRDFADCPNYVNGVEEGYFRFRYPWERYVADCLAGNCSNPPNPPGGGDSCNPSVPGDCDIN